MMHAPGVALEKKTLIALEMGLSANSHALLKNLFLERSLGMKFQFETSLTQPSVFLHSRNRSVT